MKKYFNSAICQSTKTLYLALTALVLVGSYSSSSSAATYYSCDSGYEFQVSNGAARCFRAESFLSKSPDACGNATIPLVNQSVGHFYRKNYQGNRDKCVGTFKVGPVTNTNVLDLSCTPGYSLKVSSGKDRCERRIPPKAVAPTRSVNR
mgnify:CR=1 FL=1